MASSVRTIVATVPNAGGSEVGPVWFGIVVDGDAAGDAEQYSDQRGQQLRGRQAGRDLLRSSAERTGERC